jgi:PadR family transcriptional regulator PadR
MHDGPATDEGSTARGRREHGSGARTTTHDRVASMGTRSASLATLKVLRAFLEEPGRARYGLELTELAGVKAGALYPILARLEADQWLAGAWEELDEMKAGRRKRRYYQLTSTGEAVARALLEETIAELELPARTARRRPSRRRPAFP